MKHPNIKQPTTTASQWGSLTQVGTVVLQLLGELLEVGLAQWDHLPAAGLLQHGPVPVVGTHGPQQDPILGGGQQPSAQSQSKGTENPVPKLCRWPWGWVWGLFSCYFSPIRSNSCPHRP